MPKERILPYIILGLVGQSEPMTGQEITNQFKNEIGKFWKASHSQIYPELKRMMDDDWVLQTTDPDNAKEKYYSLTESGRDALSDWLLSPVKEAPMQKDLFSLKMFFIRDAGDSRILTLLEEEEGLLAAQLDNFLERRRLLFSSQVDIEENFGHSLILDRAIDRATGQLAWIRDSIEKYKAR